MTAERRSGAGMRTIGMMKGPQLHTGMLLLPGTRSPRVPRHRSGTFAGIHARPLSTSLPSCWSILPGRAKRSPPSNKMAGQPPLVLLQFQRRKVNPGRLTHCKFSTAHRRPCTGLAVPTNTPNAAGAAPPACFATAHTDVRHILCGVLGGEVQPCSDGGLASCPRISPCI